MLLWLMKHFSSYWHILHVFHYLTLRSIIAALTSFILSLLLCPKLIAFLQRIKVGQSVRSDGPKSHLSKAGTPTMGGVLIVITSVVATLLWGDLSNYYVLLAMLVILLFAMIGGLDDYLKIARNNSKGISAKVKFMAQSLLALAAVWFLYHMATQPAELQLIIPFMKSLHPSLGLFFIALGYFVIVGTSNAVNLTDGLDGLAILPVILVMLALGLFAYLEGNVIFSHYLYIPYLPGVGELVVFCSAIVGSGLGFLWYNAYPAQIFMGDVGSLSLGAVIGLIAIMLRQELMLLIMGGVFVAETLSVILQVGSYKLRGKRIFKMAPLHHHFELKGWSEPKVIVRFWIITVVLVLLSLATLKLR
jgi:phospho-N-acetylmuramoyl-pentapeptide-transferase